MITQDDFKVRLMTRNRTNKAGLTKIEVEVMKYEYAGNRKIRKFVDTSVLILHTPDNLTTLRRSKLTTSELVF